MPDSFDVPIHGFHSISRCRPGDSPATKTPGGASRNSCRLYPVAARPRIEALHVDGDWCSGQLHAWLLTSSGWHAVVSYHDASGLQYYTWLPARQVRPHPADPLDAGEISGDAR